MGGQAFPNAAGEVRRAAPFPRERAADWPVGRLDEDGKDARRWSSGLEAEDGPQPRVGGKLSGETVHQQTPGGRGIADIGKDAAKQADQAAAAGEGKNGRGRIDV